MKHASFVNCPGCGEWIAVPLVDESVESPSSAAGTDNAADFELRDKSGTGRMILGWQESSRTSAPDRAFRTYKITLEFSNQINASAALPTDISQTLIQYFDELVAIEGDWSDARQFRDPDDQLSIRCDCYRGKVSFDVSLGAEFDDPAWIVELCLRVKQSELKGIAGRLRAFFGIKKTD